ncbi:Reverse transcriptase ribonuclease h [Mycena indigotica]|uniref:Reverse transcriptase ribonuclease h n=1 Tax=Mycena indigotica TaxID=2126181 RepID=A0A8H6TBL0_9AGAR|nr:Reverse transcriptase ribonuclease h [Mycena indigotica]KAF7315770.1 Reverse transcriptase ribonuclease h [Mycena indigotica]
MPNNPNPRLLSDPNLAICPDFSSDAYDIIRAALTTQNSGITDPIAALQKSWTDNNEKEKERWANQVAADEAERAEQERLRREAEDQAAAAVAQAAEAEKLEAEKKKPKLGDFNITTAPPARLETRLSHYAQKKLEKKEYVYLWPFTPKGLAETEIASLSSADDSSTFKLSQNADSELTVLAGPSAGSHKSMRRDQELEFREFELGSNRYLAELPRFNFPEQHVNALAVFFYDVVSHPMRAQAHGEQILLKYADRYREEWFRTLGTPAAFNISLINEDGLERIRQSRVNTLTNGNFAFSLTSCHLPLPLAVAVCLCRLPLPLAVEPPRGHLPFAIATQDQHDPPTAPTVQKDGLTRQALAGGTTQAHPQIAFFKAAHTQEPLRVRCASGSTQTRQSAAQKNSGMEVEPDALANEACWKPETIVSCASTGSENPVAGNQNLGGNTTTSARVVAQPLTALQAAIADRRLNPLTPLRAEAWEDALRRGQLFDRYPDIPAGLRNGFNISIPPIYSTITPANSKTLGEHQKAFLDVISSEFSARRYLGPFSRPQMEAEIGHFQSSPLSMVPKPHEIEKMRLVQNYSFPRTPKEGLFSINFYINSDDFPCTWGTLNAVSFKICMLPPGSQIGIRDVSEAYRNIPTHESQWPGAVIWQPREKTFLHSTQMSALERAQELEVMGEVGDGLADIIRSRGLGPMSKWIDDSCFLRIRREFLHEYNKNRAAVAEHLQTWGGQHHSAGRLWWGGEELPDGRIEEYDEDFATPIEDWSGVSSRSVADAEFCYNFNDINAVTDPLGVPWKSKKDIPFSEAAPYTGFIWNLADRSISLTPEKAEKYRNCITAWLAKRTHTLQEVQRLFGKLLHASIIIPAGRAYITKLEYMLGVFHDKPFMPRTSPRGTNSDLEWWLHALNRPHLSRPIPGPCEVSDTQAYSDASSGVGIAIVIKSHWRAWKLCPGWKTVGRDILWAEAIGFEFLIRTLIAEGAENRHIAVYGDNEGVVKGWWAGRSRNQEVNDVFRRIHAICENAGISIRSRYVPSEFNPADNPSRGVYPDRNQLLRPIPIPTELKDFVVNIGDRDFDLPADSTSFIASRPRPYPAHLTLIPSPLRPICFASDRLYAWSPASTSRQNSIISTSDQENIKRVLSFAWRDGTLETYGTGLLVFHCFCDTRNIPEAQRAPASRELLAAFVAAAAGSYGGKTLEGMLAGVRAWHIIHGVDWLANDSECEALLRAASALAPETSKRKPRRPFTLEIIELICNNLDKSKHQDAAIWACLTIAYYSCARLGELVVKTLASFDATKHVTKSGLRTETDRHGLETIALHIPITKACPTGEDLVFATQSGPSDPRNALAHHLSLNLPDTRSHLFCYKSGRARRPLTKSAFLKRIHQILKANNLDPLQGHGIRIGSTLFYLLRGVPFEVVKTMGRWQSDAFQLYLRKHAQILAPYIQANPELHAEFIKLSMPPIRCESPS